jgi:omega-hydroxy-beta-dihydromenaquinone-9 sulfotransferase
VLSRDEQFGWFDPVNNIGLPYSLLLGKFIKGPIEKGIADGRPQDNVQYALDLPMEETYGVLSITPYSIIHMIAFPENYKKYMSGAFVEDLSPEELEKWKKSYDFAIHKLTYIKGGKQLLLKSPDNTARVRALWSMYPDARFINIHRDPYKTIRSTINMFLLEMNNLRLTDTPDNLDELIEDTIIDIFERMYRELFELEPYFPKNRYIDIAYTDFCAAPLETLHDIYRQLEIPDFDAAAPRFQAYIDSQRGYQKNKFDISPRLVRKINDRLGFYMEHYGYEMREADET